MSEDQELLHTEAGEIVARRRTAATVHRVGYAPTPWQWTDWSYALDGRFDGRWDDPGGFWRTLYVGQTRLACLLELLARFRPSKQVAAEIAEIEVEDDEEFPTVDAGTLPISWCAPRRSGTARMSGVFAVPGHHLSIAALRVRFRQTALTLGLADLDAAAIRDSRPRKLTRAISAWLYEVGDEDIAKLDGIEFSSRHGDDLTLWAIYERGSDDNISAQLAPLSDEADIDPDDPELRRAMELLGLRWAD